MRRILSFGALLNVVLVACAEEFPIGCWTFMTQERQRPVEQVVKDWKDLGMTCAILLMRAAVTVLLHWERQHEEE